MLTVKITFLWKNYYIKESFKDSSKDVDMHTILKPMNPDFACWQEKITTKSVLTLGITPYVDATKAVGLHAHKNWR